MGNLTLQHGPWAAIAFLSFLVVCALLAESRFGRKGTIAVWAGLLAGIGLVQAGLLLSGQDPMLVLTILPLTAYLPTVIAVHVLSRAGFFPTIAVWAVAAMVSFILVFLQKLLIRSGFGGTLAGGDLVQTGCLVLAGVLLAWIVYRRLRSPFRAFVLQGEVGWPSVCLPVALVFLLLSYFENSVSDPTMTVLVFLTALSVFLIVVRVFVISASARSAWEAKRAVAEQLDIQRREYETVLEKMELGRAYRHDMRHHLLVLEDLADKGDDREIAGYLDSLGARFRETERSVLCENAAVNAVLSSYVDQAKEAGCSVTVRARMPARLPVDEVDLCILLANALENALHACENVGPERARAIDVDIVCDDDCSLRVSVENSCAERLRFDDEGLPVVPVREGRGIGLRSIKAIVDRHHGMFQCSCEEEAFLLRAVLFAPREAGSPRRKAPLLQRVPYGAQAFVAVFVVAACMPSTAQALGALGAGGSLVEVVAGERLGFTWGDTAFSAVIPQVKVLAAEGSAAAQEKESPEEAASEPADAEAEEPTPSEDAHSEAVEDEQPGDSAAASPSQTASSTPKVDPPASGTISWESSGQKSETDATGPVVPVVTIPSSPTGPETTDPSAQTDPDDSSAGQPSEADREEPDVESVPNSGPNEVDPVPPALAEGVEDINQRMEDYVAAMREKFLWYASRAYNGYVGMDVTYEVVRDDEALLSIRFDATLNAGGSGQYSRTFTLDKRSGSVLELKDLFVEGSDYVGAISSDILRQMTAQVQAGLADYFVSGAGWPEESCFKQIDADQHFYIDANDQLVIVFDKYAVAPGTHGSPEFVVGAEALDGVLQSPTLLR